MPANTEHILQSYLTALGTINDTAWDVKNRTLASTLRFKDLENGISLVHNAALVLGMDEIGSENFQLNETCSIEEIEDKYYWLLHDQPQNETQRRLCGMFNLIKVTQIIDDKSDLYIDNTIGLHNIYTEALKESGGDRTAAQAKLKSLEDRYLSKANKFGISKVALTGNTLFASTFKILQHQFPNIFGGLRERIIGKQ